VNTKPLKNYSTRKWLVITIIAAIFGAVLLFLITVGYTSSPITLASALILGGAISGCIFVIFALLDRQTQHLEELIEHHIEAAHADLKASIAIRPFTKYPLRLGTWDKGYAATAYFLERLSREIILHKPALILECGSGSSTILNAACLKQLGKGKIISLDDDPEYAQITRMQIEAENLEDWAEVVSAPTRQWELNEKNWSWYDFDPAGYINQPIDMLIVDGPPGTLQPLARYPAVPILKEYLSSACVILLDDGSRADEAKIAKKWAEMLQVKMKFIDGGRGIWLLKNES
jgi:predicted O-methyltransferase YrrM